MECDRPDMSKDGVRQGDILAAHPGTDNWKDRWKRFYVVVTADCDMAQRKNRAGVVVVPVIGLTTYLDEVWLIDQLSKYDKLLWEKLEPLLNRFSGPRITPRQLLGAEPSDLASDLTSRASGNSDLLALVQQVKELHLGIQEVEVLRSQPSPANPSERMDRFFVVRDQYTKKSTDREKELLSALNGLLDPKRLDTWPICDLLGLDGQMREDETLGFVACLRFFTTLPYDAAYISKEQWLKDPLGYHRICRLRGIYKSDLIQKFAQMFSRVGLEDERDREHQRVFAHVASKVSQRKLT